MRIRELLARRVNVICNSLSVSVFPSVWNLCSLWLCFSSGRISNGWLKNICSASTWLTPCFCMLFRSLPSSQSKPEIRVHSIIYVYYHHIQYAQVKSPVACKYLSLCLIWGSARCQGENWVLSMKCPLFIWGRDVSHGCTVYETNVWINSALQLLWISKLL